MVAFSIRTMDGRVILEETAEENPLIPRRGERLYVDNQSVPYFVEQIEYSIVAARRDVPNRVVVIVS